MLSLQLLRDKIRAASDPTHAHLNEHCHGVANGLIIAFNTLSEEADHLALVPRPPKYTSELAADGKGLGLAAVELLGEIYRSGETSESLLKKINDLVSVYQINLETQMLRRATEKRPAQLLLPTGVSIEVSSWADILAIPVINAVAEDDDFARFYIVEDAEQGWKKVAALYTTGTKVFLADLTDPDNVIRGL